MAEGCEVIYEFFASYEPKPDWRSAGIMFATKCKFSHVGIIENGSKIFHATRFGFGEETVEEFELTHKYAHRWELHVPDPIFASGWLRGNVGKDYSESQFVGFLFKIPFIRKLFSDGRSELICSEAAIRFGIECCGLRFDGNPDFVSPEESVEIMKQIQRVK
jgi:hypothetical protein